MADKRRFADAESLRPVVRAAFGRGRALVGAERLAGGSKKGAYRLTMDDGGTALLYAWSDSEDYWQGVLPAETDDPADPFSHASGLALFEAAARRLAAAGARCPEILFTDRSGDRYPADVAVVEDVPGGSLEALLDDDPGAAERPLSVLADWLAGLAAVRSPSFGKVAFVDAGGRSPGTSCERVMLDRALAQLQEIAGRDRRAAAAQGRLEDALRSLAEPIEPRATWALVHGELGPDHVLLDRRGEPVLIDVEGARYFDVETEHVWTRMRFGGHHARLSPGGLDEDRLRLYQLCMHLDLVAGPLRIAGTSHPERAWFRGVAEHHLQCALQFPALTSSRRCINGGRQLHLLPHRSRPGRRRSIPFRRDRFIYHGAGTTAIDWEAAISALHADDPGSFPAIHYSPHPRGSHYVTMHEVLDPERADQVLRAAYPDERQRDYAMRWLGWIAFHMGADERLDWWAIPAWVPPTQLVTARRLAAWAVLTAAAGLAIAATVQAAILFGIVGWIAAVQAFFGDDQPDHGGRVDAVRCAAGRDPAASRLPSAGWLAAMGLFALGTGAFAGLMTGRYPLLKLTEFILAARCRERASFQRLLEDAADRRVLLRADGGYEFADEAVRASRSWARPRSPRRRRSGPGGHHVRGSAPGSLACPMARSPGPASTSASACGFP